MGRSKANRARQAAPLRHSRWLLCRANDVPEAWGVFRENFSHMRVFKTYSHDFSQHVPVVCGDMQVALSAARILQLPIGQSRPIAVYFTTHDIASDQEHTACAPMICPQSTVFRCPPSELGHDDGSDMTHLGPQIGSESRQRAAQIPKT